MPRYKDYSYEQHKFIPVSFQQQMLPGTFENTLNYLIDHEIDLSVRSSLRPAHRPMIRGFSSRSFFTLTRVGLFRAVR